MEKLDRYNIMRFVYGVYHSHRIRYKDYGTQTISFGGALLCFASQSTQAERYGGLKWY